MLISWWVFVVTLSSPHAIYLNTCNNVDFLMSICCDSSLISADAACEHFYTGADYIFPDLLKIGKALPSVRSWRLLYLQGPEISCPWNDCDIFARGGDQAVPMTSTTFSISISNYLFYTWVAPSISPLWQPARRYWRSGLHGAFQFAANVKKYKDERAFLFPWCVIAFLPSVCT